jgi:hypothetical protein
MALELAVGIYGLFVVTVVVPRGGRSKGRALAFIEEGDSRRACDLLIPNGLSSSELERYVVQRYAAFARPGREVRRLDAEHLAA